MVQDQLTSLGVLETFNCDKTYIKTYLLLSLLLLWLLYFIAFIQGVYYYVPETYRLSRVYSVALVL